MGRIRTDRFGTEDTIIRPSGPRGSADGVSVVIRLIRSIRSLGCCPWCAGPGPKRARLLSPFRCPFPRPRPPVTSMSRSGWPTQAATLLGAATTTSSRPLGGRRAGTVATTMRIGPSWTPSSLAERGTTSSLPSRWVAVIGVRGSLQPHGSGYRIRFISPLVAMPIHGVRHQIPRVGAAFRMLQHPGQHAPEAVVRLCRARPAIDQGEGYMDRR